MSHCIDNYLDKTIQFFIIMTVTRTRRSHFFSICYSLFYHRVPSCWPRVFASTLPQVLDGVDVCCQKHQNRCYHFPIDAFMFTYDLVLHSLCYVYICTTFHHMLSSFKNKQYPKYWFNLQVIGKKSFWFNGWRPKSDAAFLDDQMPSERGIEHYQVILLNMVKMKTVVCLIFGLH